MGVWKGLYLCPVCRCLAVELIHGEDFWYLACTECGARALTVEPEEK